MQIPMAVAILTTMLNGDGFTAGELAARFEISQRSVYRYLDALTEAGVPMISQKGRNGGWKIDSNYRLSSTYFTKEEYGRLLFSLQSNPISDHLTSNLIAKLGSLSHGVTNSFVLQSDQLVVDATVADDLRERINSVKQAISEKRVLAIEYHSKEGVTEREVEPHCLVLKDGAWYAYCFCKLRKDFRYFKVSRITSIRDVGRYFKARPFTVDSDKLGTDVLRGRETIEMILTVKKSALAKVEEWLGVSKVAKIGDEYMAKAQVPFDDFTVDKVLSCGEGVVVETPSVLKEAVKHRCAQIAANY
ncbi:MAG: YafY family transcriptional regulator [Corallococcus sp.]|nr:YafY family transcriptional regulator [Corallococcus sp.]